MLAPQPFFEPRGTPFSVLGRLRALSVLGHEVHLVTYHLGQDVAIPNVAVYRTPRLGFIRQVRVGPSVTKLFLDVLLMAKAIHLLWRGRYDLLHTHEEAAFFGILLAKAFRLRHLYDMHSSLPQQLRNFRYTRFRPLIRLFEVLERWAVNASDSVITICPALEEHVRQINGHVPHMMIENVPSEAAPERALATSRESRNVAQLLGNGKKIVLYTGTFEAYQGIDLVLGSARRVLDERRDVMFVLVGGQPHQVQHYRSRIQDLGFSDHFLLPGTLPPQDIPGFVGHSDVLISPRTSGTNTPLKIYAYLQSGKPIVATNISAHTQVLTPEVAVLVEPNADAFARGVLSVLADPSRARERADRARDLFEQRYSFSGFVEKTQRALEMAAR